MNIFIMRIFLICLFLQINCTLFYSQQYIITKAPINNNYKIDTNYQSINKKETHNLGYRPPPLLVPKTNSKLKSSSLTNYPTSYDLRKNGFITPVKDQGVIGSCWSFGVIGAIESNALQFINTYYDLSEENMATCHNFLFGKNDGSNL